MNSKDKTQKSNKKELSRSKSSRTISRKRKTSRSYIKV